MSNFKMDDYVPVNERIEAFYAKHPEGTLQSEIVELTADRVTVKAYAYRAADDERPGIGHSSLEIPGSTSFTRGSEIENAETSAWGRAIAALGFEVKRGVSSREEVRNKQPERSERASSVRREDSKPATTSAPVKRTPEENALLTVILEEPGMTQARMRLMADAVGVPKGQHATADQLRAMIERFIESPGSGVPTASPALEQPSATDGDGAAPVARGGESSESPPPTAGSEGAVSPSLPSGPALDPQALLESAQAIVGGEIVDVVPPELQARIERARAKGKAKEEPETLAEQLRVEA
jgi:hypothetical protein